MLLLAAGRLAVAAQGPDPARVHAWKADLHAFAMHLLKNHPAPFRTLSREGFEARLQELDQCIERESDPEIAARWSALIAALGDEHTEVEFAPELGRWRLPIALRLYADGPIIVSATAPLRHLLGARLDRVEHLGLDQLQQGLRGYLPYHQDGWFRTWFEEGFEASPLLLQAAGLAKVKPIWSLEGTLADGRHFSESVALLTEVDSSGLAWLNEPMPKGTPLQDQEPKRAYFFRVLPRERALYLRCRRCEDDDARPFGRWLRGALQQVRSRRLTRVVVDLRGNTGGQEALVDQLVLALQASPGLNRTGGLVALTDGSVFSSGAVAAWRLRHELGAALIGDACGAAVNHVGSVIDIELPSGRIAWFGTELHVIDTEHPEDFTSPITPDVHLPLRHADLLQGKDPALDRALALPPAPPR